MQTEALYWSHDYKAAVTSATQFRALYTPDRFHRVHWTLAFFQASALEYLGKYDEAAKLFAEFMAAVDNQALWPKQDHHIRAAYHRLNCLEAAKAPSDQIAAARSFLLANYPGTVWAQRVLEKEDGKPWRPRWMSGKTE